MLGNKQYGLSGLDFGQWGDGNAGGEDGAGIKVGEIAEDGVVVEDGAGGNDGPGADGGVGVNQGVGEHKGCGCDAGGRADVGGGMDQGRTTGSNGDEAVEESFADGQVANGDGHGGIGGGEPFQVGEGCDGIGGNIIQKVGGRVAAGQSKFRDGAGVGPSAEKQNGIFQKRKTLVHGKNKTERVESRVVF